MKINPNRMVDVQSLERDMRVMAERAGKQPQEGKQSEKGFLDMLKEGIENVNSQGKEAETMSLNLASGKDGNLHETMLAATRAELGIQLLVQMRNKAIESYQEVMRMNI